MQGYIVHLNGARLPPAVGNKASRVHFLARHGFRVPVTHVCTWNAYLKYLEDDHSLITALTNELQQKIDLARAYAVRWSANIEDGLTYSFAGQFKTVLDVRGADTSCKPYGRSGPPRARPAWKPICSKTALIRSNCAWRP